VVGESGKAMEVSIPPCEAALREIVTRLSIEGHQ
jgi:hypothetical protein